MTQEYDTKRKETEREDEHRRVPTNNTVTGIRPTGWSKPPSTDAGLGSCWPAPGWRPACTRRRGRASAKRWSRASSWARTCATGASSKPPTSTSTTRRRTATSCGWCSSRTRMYAWGGGCRGRNTSRATRSAGPRSGDVPLDSSKRIREKSRSGSGSDSGSVTQSSVISGWVRALVG